MKSVLPVFVYERRKWRLLETVQRASDFPAIDHAAVGEGETSGNAVSRDSMFPRCSYRDRHR